MTSTQNLASIVTTFLRQLERQPNLYNELVELISSLSQQNSKVYACGGMIRDIVISHIYRDQINSCDFDFVIEGATVSSFQQVMNRLERRSSAIESVTFAGKSFPVWKVKIRYIEEMVDFALTRTEASFGCNHRDFIVSSNSVNIEEDAIRRDFTINGLYIELFLDNHSCINGELIDFYNGLQDIYNGKITCIGRAEDRFREDPLRLLRAIRFASRFTGFSIEQETAKFIDQLAPILLETLPKERVIEELYKTLSRNAHKGLKELKRFGILALTFPQLAEKEECFLSRIAARIDYLIHCDNDEINKLHLFGAILIEFAAEELQEKEVVSMNGVKMPARFLDTEMPNLLARQLKIPNVREVTSLCNDTLLVFNRELLINGEAVIEEVCLRYKNLDSLVRFYEANCHALQLPQQVNLRNMVSALPAPVLDFGRLLRRSQIPPGQHLQTLKTCLRQAEINNSISSEDDAVGLLIDLYENEHAIAVENSAPAEQKS